eukprot:Gb_22325 [translate_table: standard]
MIIVDYKFPKRIIDYLDLCNNTKSHKLSVAQCLARVHASHLKGALTEQHLYMHIDHMKMNLKKAFTCTLPL